MFNQGGKIEKGKVTVIKDVLKDPDEKDYYASPGYAFIFSYSKMEKLWKKMKADSCLVLLKGAREWTKDDGNKTNGRPTLIAMVYHPDEAVEYLVLDEASVGSGRVNDIGSEHPDGYPPDRFRDGTEGIPTKIEIDKIIRVAMR